ncbi:MAG: DUF6178 family protein [Deltaproteobacteria bacterium]|nr:DUF6178 family protein [Deltaproteobacteria bacterium]MDD9853831.1 DUF6178 family protein [Deltaproteobacteria bacterium]
MATLQGGAANPGSARRILALAAEDRAAARRALAQLGFREQAALICAAPLSRRAALLDLVESPEQVVPALPPAELCYTLRQIGLDDATWLIACASEAQLAAALDLDAWRGWLPDLSRAQEWLRAIAEAGEPALLRAARALDMELLLLLLRARAQVLLRLQSDEDWSPPPGGQTLDGAFYLLALRPEDDLADLLALLRVLFQRDYWRYFRLLQAVPWEQGAEAEEWALRWRNGRLADLGFPAAGDAKRIYARLAPGELAQLPLPQAPQPPAPAGLPAWTAVLPAPTGGEGGFALFRAIAALPEPERRPHILAFLALVNRVAVADEAPLGEPETMPQALRKAVDRASLGLEFLAREHALSLADALRRAPAERLFQVGHALHAKAAGAEAQAD